MCDCVSITFRLRDELTSTTIEINVSGTFNGENYYQWNYLGIDYFLYYNPTGGGEWEVSVGGLGSPPNPMATAWKNSLPPCPPLGSMPVWGPGGIFDEFTTSDCVPEPPIEDSCNCGIDIKIGYNTTITTFELQITGTENGRNSYSWTGDIGYGMDNFHIIWDGIQWTFKSDLNGILSYLNYDSNCPFSDSNQWYSIWKYLRITTTALECKNCGIEERIYREYDAIKLPENFEEPNRGLKGCCQCEYLVFANGSSSTFENDVTSAWMKLSDSADIMTFILEDSNGNPTNYIPIPQPFIKEPFAFYSTIKWKDVLNTDGEGCYTLKINYEISGIVGFVIWGKFKLQKYSIQNTLKTARVRAFFNAYHEVEQIDFTDSNVESSFRFYGFIGNRQPNTEIDNIIYQNREMKSVIRENLNQYEIITEPVYECFTRPLIELFLLSENDLFISDYNAHNHSYRIQDLPVILEESAQLNYLPLSRYAILTCKVGDKYKNKRTHF
jgi:hypothetical protein